MLADTLSRCWWMVLLRGLVWIAFGAMLLAWPGISILTLTLFFGASALVDGVLNVGNALSGKRDHDDWWILLLMGFTGIAVGILTFANTGATALALLFYIAIWATVTGVLQVLAAIRLRREIEGELWMALSGLASILFGVALIANPTAGALALAWLIGCFAIVIGAILVLLSFAVRRAVKRLVSAVRTG